jgi:hypothetical protein
LVTALWDAGTNSVEAQEIDRKSEGLSTWRADLENWGG